jgi:hypothetical protein
MRIYIVVFALILAACSFEEHASYEPLENTLAAGGPLLVVTNGTPSNVKELTDRLEPHEAETFEESLSWYGTEADSPMSVLGGKSAREIVSIVNCLKKNPNSTECGIANLHNE